MKEKAPQAMLAIKFHELKDTLSADDKAQMYKQISDIKRNIYENSDLLNDTEKI